MAENDSIDDDDDDDGARCRLEIGGAKHEKLAILSTPSRRSNSNSTRETFQHGCCLVTIGNPAAMVVLYLFVVL